MNTNTMIDATTMKLLTKINNYPLQSDYEIDNPLSTVGKLLDIILHMLLKQAYENKDSEHTILFESISCEDYKPGIIFISIDDNNKISLLSSSDDIHALTKSSIKIIISILEMYKYTVEYNEDSNIMKIKW